MARKRSPGRPASQRFWSHVTFGPLDECWLWNGSVNTDTGYGEFVVGRVDGRRIRMTAHRCAWRFTHGEIPEGLQVNHHCDVRLCVNPRHLYVGTQEENMRDMVSRGRSAGRMRRKFTPDQVREIRTSPETGAACARRLGVDQATISLIRSRKTYPDVV